MPSHRSRPEAGAGGDRPSPADAGPALSAVRIAGADLRGVNSIVGRLLDPFAMQSIEHWQLSILRDCRSLLGADMASLLLPGGAATPVVSEDIPQEHWQAFFAITRPLDREWHMWSRHISLGVVDRKRLWGLHLRQYLQSSYYNDFVVPNRYLDALVLAVPLVSDGLVGPDRAAGLWFHHQSDRGARFGDRGLALLTLLLPSFRVAARAVADLRGQQATFGQMCDGLSEPLGVYAFDGRRVHWTPTLASLIGADSEAARLELAIATVARQLALLRTQGLDMSAGMALPNRVVRTASATYRVSATLAPPSTTTRGSADTILVFVRRLGAAAEDPGRRLRAVQDAGLTSREAEVALCIADGMGTDAIARRLAISGHTVKRHLERVYTKLGVSARAEVAPAILQLCRRGVEAT